MTQGRGDLDHGEALAIEMPAQRWQKLCRFDADHEADLRTRPGPRRDGVDGILGIAGAHGENFKAAPSEHLFRQA
jgi:hypothetical protein